jgi:hypothetical protein
MLEIGKKSVLAIFDKWRLSLLEKMEMKDSFADRIAAKHAAVISAAEIASTALKLPFDLPGIEKLLLDNYKCSMESRDKAQDAYNYFLEQFNVYRNRFISSYPSLSSNLKPAYGEIWGRVTKNKEGILEIAILTTKFEEIMRSGKYSNPKAILRAWKAKKLLDYESDRLTRQRQINDNIRVNVYVVRIKDSGGKKKSKEINSDTE